MGIDKNEWGFRVGHLPHGERNKISDVPGVTVGHCTLADGDIQTGVTALLPHPGDVFHDKVLAACHVINGFGKTTGLVQIDELGTLETPILFTFRTRKEGGEKEIDMEAYTALNTAVAQSGDADAVDVEVFSGDEVVRRNIQAIHAAGKAVVGSNHDFGGTPDKADLLFRLRKMQELGADIPKIAVMPRCPGDVIALLDATQEMSGKYADRPIITMSMGAGVVSRLCGEYFGSAMTFGAVGQVSAPGQIPVEELNAAMDILHRALAPRS